MSTYNIVASTNQSTVVSEYIPDEKRATAYQSEAELENEFIRLLTTLGYEYIKINNEAELIKNLRLQLERLNNFSFLDSEWNRFYKERIASSNDGIVEKTKKIQVDYVQEFRCDDGQLKNIYLLDKKNIHNNRLQVINQYEEKDGNHETRWRRVGTAEKENINDDIVFELELVKQVEVNIDYILILVSKYHAGNCEDKEILVDINKAISASTQLRSKKELIESFIETINTSTKVEDDWSKFVNEQKEADLTAIMNEENLKPAETRKFIDNSFRDGELRTSGTAIDKILPPMPLFGASGNNRQTKKKTIVEKLSKFFEKYLGLV